MTVTKDGEKGAYEEGRDTMPGRVSVAFVYRDTMDTIVTIVTMTMMMMVITMMVTTSSVFFIDWTISIARFSVNDKPMPEQIESAVEEAVMQTQYTGSVEMGEEEA